MNDKSATDPTSHPPMGRLKERAEENMRPMVCTELVFQSPMSWSKSEAPSKTAAMLTTELVSHAPMGLLKARAYLNLANGPAQRSNERVSE